MRAATIGACIVLALLELAHPAWAGSAVADGVVAAGSRWVPLHIGLLMGYAALCGLLWVSAPLGPAARAALVVFGVANTAFLAIDGLAVGLTAPAAPGVADTLWSSTAVTVLADVTGAAWCLTLLLLGAARAPRPPDRYTAVLLALAWLAFIASDTVVGLSPLVSRGLALAAGAWLAYRFGTAALPAAVLIFGAVLRQHVGPEAALGVVCLALAAALPAAAVDRRTV